MEDTQTRKTIQRFELAFQTHDPTDLAAIIADDCVLENTGPAPNGATYQGKKACLEFWSSLAADTSMRFDEERVDILGERAIVLWRPSWDQDIDQSVRGVNIMRVTEGKIVEALGYIKS